MSASEGLPDGFVPAWTFIKTEDGMVEYAHPAGEAIEARTERVQALRDSAKAHIEQRLHTAKQAVRDSWEQGSNQSVPAFSWSDAQAWLDDWEPPA